MVWNAPSVVSRARKLVVLPVFEVPGATSSSLWTLRLRGVPHGANAGPVDPARSVACQSSSHGPAKLCSRNQET